MKTRKPTRVAQLITIVTTLVVGMILGCAKLCHADAPPPMHVSDLKRCMEHRNTQCMLDYGESILDKNHSTGIAWIELSASYGNTDAQLELESQCECDIDK